MVLLAEVFVCFLDLAIGGTLLQAKNLHCSVSVIVATPVPIEDWGGFP